MVPRTQHPVVLRAYDYAVAAVLGGTCSLTSWTVVPVPWATPIAMIVGMGAGLLVALPLFGLFSWILGGFELLVLSLQVAMLAGMAGAMLRPVPIGSVVAVGVVVGLVVELAIHLLDRSLHGEVPLG